MQAMLTLPLVTSFPVPQLQRAVMGGPQNPARHANCQSDELGSAEAIAPVGTTDASCEGTGESTWSL